MPEPLDHPEPELIDVRDPERSRAALERLGERTWKEALDWLYGTAADRPTAPDLYPEMRRTFFGERGRPGPAPSHGSGSDEVFGQLAVDPCAGYQHSCVREVGDCREDERVSERAA